MLYKKIFIPFFFIISIFYAQKTETIITNVIVGLPDYISYDKAVVQAKKKCFVQALEESKTSVFIKRKSQSLTILKNDSITTDLYYYDINTSQNARISDYEITRKKIIENQNNRKLEMTMKVLIKTYETKKDASFSYKVKGIKLTYKDGDNLSFSFRPNNKGYLNIFYIDDEESYKLFPNEDEKENYFEKGIKYSFPRNEYLNYTLTSSENEDNIIIFIFTKLDIRFEKEFSKKNLFKEIYSLELDEINYKIVPIKILKK
jgi:hypothetical protein